MTDRSMELMNETLDVIKTNSEAIFNSGVIHGVTIVKDLIMNNNEVTDLDTLAQVLNLFINKYSDNPENSMNEEDKNIETVPSSNIVLEDLDDSEGNVYRGYIIPTLKELEDQNSSVIAIKDIEETEKISIGVTLDEVRETEDPDKTIRDTVMNYIDKILDKDVLVLEEPKKFSDHFRQGIDK